MFISIISLRKHIDCFVLPFISSSERRTTIDELQRQCCHIQNREQQEYRIKDRAASSVLHVRYSFTILAVASDNYSNDADDDDDDDEYIDTDSLGDWRNFRRSLSTTIETDDGNNLINNADYRDEYSKKKNEEALKKQDKELAEEYATGAWAHVTSTVSIRISITAMIHNPLSN